MAATGDFPLNGVKAAAKDYLERREQNRQARTALAEDKKARLDGSILARLADAVSITDAESAAHTTAVDLGIATEDFDNACLRWLERSTGTFHGKAAQRFADLLQRRAKLGHWLALARSVDEHLYQAITACQSASVFEMVDVTSKGAGNSWLSASFTQSAAEALDKADAAIDAFRAVFPKRGSDTTLAVLDEQPNPLFDFSFDSVFDARSWKNMNDLKEAIRHCEATKRDFAPVLERLEQLLAEGSEDFSSHRERAALDLSR